MERFIDSVDGGGLTARRVAWAVVILLGCAFSYSIGWQAGWTRGASGAESRLRQFNDLLIGTRAATVPNDGPAADDPNDTA